MDNRIVVLVIAAVMLAACSAERLYESAQAYQRNQCGTIADRADYDRCVTSTNASYDAYTRQTQTK